MSFDAPNQYANESSSRSAASHRGRVFFIYLIFGPPIGGIITILGGFIYAAYETGFEHLLNDGVDFRQVIIFPFWVLMLSLFGYIFGGVQAALTGVIIACLSSNEGRFGYGLAFAAPVLVGLVAGIVLAYPMTTGVMLSAYLGVIGVLASLAIRFLFRKRFRREDVDHVKVSAHSA